MDRYWPWDTDLSKMHDDDLNRGWWWLQGVIQGLNALPMDLYNTTAPQNLRDWALERQSAVKAEEAGRRERAAHEQAIRCEQAAVSVLAVVIEVERWALAAITPWTGVEKKKAAEDRLLANGMGFAIPYIEWALVQMSYDLDELAGDPPASHEHTPAVSCG